MKRRRGLLFKRSFQLCFLAVIFIPFGLIAQHVNSYIEKPVDEITYKAILEYYSYDAGMSSDPVNYGEWPWRGPHTLYKISYRSVR